MGLTRLQVSVICLYKVAETDRTRYTDIIAETCMSIQLVFRYELLSFLEQLHSWCISATAWYRLLPEIVLKRPVVGQQAHRLKKCFPEGVIEVDDVDG